MLPRFEFKHSTGEVEPESPISGYQDKANKLTTIPSSVRIFFGDSRDLCNKKGRLEKPAFWY